MEASKVSTAQWTVVIVVEDDACLTGTYRMTPSTKLSQLMEIWKDDFELNGQWVFKSANEEFTFHDDWMTLEMVVPSVSRARVVLTLTAELCYEPTPRPVSEIYAFVNDRCHQLSVKPNEKLYKVLCRLPGQPKFFEFKGQPLNVNHTVLQAGLGNYSVIYEVLRSITVKLSNGYSRVFQMPQDNLVLHLKEKVNLYETDNFSLWCQGRFLKPDESLRQLSEAVEVTTAEFVVHIDGRSIKWRSKAEPITVSEFIPQLSTKGNIDAQRIETMEFVCVGCQRRIWNSKDDIQQLPVECCKERSLTLNTVAPSDRGTNLETDEASKHIISLHKHLVQYRVNESRTERSRRVYRQMKEKLETEGLNYNMIAGCSGRLLRRVNELEKDIKTWEIANDVLKNKNFAIELKAGELEAENTRLIEENRKLNAENNALYDQLGVKLLVFFRHDKFTPVSQPEVQEQGVYPWDTNWPFIKVHIPEIRAGSASFEELRNVLQRFVSGPEIGEIAQRRGAVAGREVARVSSRDEDVAVTFAESPYCDIHGAEHSWEEAGKPPRQFISADGRVFLCGGRRRTVLAIY